MIIPILIDIIRAVAWVLKVAVIANVILAYFMSPWHPVRQALNRVIEPMIRPIRRIIPPVAMIDFSPVVLIILIQILEYLLISLLASAA